jgi:hypothetical protein
VSDDDAWGTLGVAYDATPAEVTSAWKRLCEIYHPDRYAEARPEVRVEAARLMSEANAAYRSLLDGTAVPAPVVSPASAAPVEVRTGRGLAIALGVVGALAGLAAGYELFGRVDPVFVESTTVADTGDVGTDERPATFPASLPLPDDLRFIDGRELSGADGGVIVTTFETLTGLSPDEVVTFVQEAFPAAGYQGEVQRSEGVAGITADLVTFVGADARGTATVTALDDGSRIHWTVTDPPAPSGAAPPATATPTAE